MTSLSYLKTYVLYISCIMYTTLPPDVGQLQNNLKEYLQQQKGFKETRRNAILDSFGCVTGTLYLEPYREPCIVSEKPCREPYKTPCYYAISGIHMASLIKNGRPYRWIYASFYRAFRHDSGVVWYSDLYHVSGYFYDRYAG